MPEAPVAVTCFAGHMSLAGRFDMVLHWFKEYSCVHSTLGYNFYNGVKKSCCVPRDNAHTMRLVSVTLSFYFHAIFYNDKVETCGNGFVSSQVREEKLWAKAVVIDGPKEWYCRHFSETNVWTKASAEEAKLTFRRVCKVSICKLCPRREGVVGRLRHLRVGGGEDHMLACTAQWAKEAELRELRGRLQFLDPSAGGSKEMRNGWAEQG